MFKLDKTADSFGTRQSIFAVRSIICRLVHFVMGLKKLRTLSINLGGVYGKSGAAGDLRKLQKHPSLQGIHLSLDWEENARRPQAVDVPLTNTYAASSLHSS